MAKMWNPNTGRYQGCTVSAKASPYLLKHVSKRIACAVCEKMSLPNQCKKSRYVMTDEGLAYYVCANCAEQENRFAKHNKRGRRAKFLQIWR